MDKIYMIIPVYNVEKYLERCIQSLLKQSYSNVIIILIDDGSNDSSGLICDEYAKEYDNIITIHQENEGLSGARNSGIEYVIQNEEDSNCWLTFIDSDDYVHSEYIQKLYGACIESNTKLSICGYLRTWGNDTDYGNNQLKYFLYTPEEMWDKDRTNAVLAWGKLYHIDLWKDKRFPKGKINEDEFTTYKILFTQEKIAHIPEKLYYYFQSDYSIMRQSWNPKRLHVLEALKNQIEFFKTYNHHIAFMRSLEALCEHSIKSVRAIEVASPKYDEYLKNTKKIMRNALLQYGKEKGFYGAWCFWVRFRIKHPIAKSLKNESIIQFAKRQIRRLFKRK